MIPLKIPGTAAGKIILLTVLNFPAPKPKLPSLYESGMESKASSVVLITVGRIMIATVAAPDRMEYPHPKKTTNRSIPNKP